jgi:hypothetical protein
MNRLKSITVLILVCSSFLTMLDISSFYDSDVIRLFFKYFGQLLLAIASLVVLLINIRSKQGHYIMNQFLLSFSLSLPFLTIFIGELINSPQDSLISFFRFVTSFLLISSVAFFDKVDAEQSILLFEKLIFIVASLGIFTFVLQLGGGEKYPLLNLKSTKSIIFEQNLFGILCFYGFWLTISHTFYHRRPSLINTFIFIGGLFFVVF